MKYTVEIEINAPLATVVELFDRPANMSQWMPNLTGIETLSGTAGHVGAKSKMSFNNGRSMEETVLLRNLPEEFTASYEFQGLTYVVQNHFYGLPRDKTRYVSVQDFRLKGWMKLMGALMPGVFRKESMKHMVMFKAFVERSAPKP